MIASVQSHKFGEFSIAEHNISSTTPLPSVPLPTQSRFKCKYVYKCSMHCYFPRHILKMKSARIYTHVLFCVLYKHMYGSCARRNNCFNSVLFQACVRICLCEFWNIIKMRLYSFPTVHSLVCFLIQFHWNVHAASFLFRISVYRALSCTKSISSYFLMLSHLQPFSVCFHSFSLLHISFSRSFVRWFAHSLSFAFTSFSRVGTSCVCHAIYKNTR